MIPSGIHQTTHGGRPLWSAPRLVLCALLASIGLASCTFRPAHSPDSRSGEAGIADDSLSVELELKRLEAELARAGEKGASMSELRRLFLDIQSLNPDLAGPRQDQLSLDVARLIVDEMDEEPGLETELEAGTGIHSLDFAVEQYGDSLEADSLLAGLMLPNEDSGELDSVLVRELDSLTVPGIPDADQRSVEQMIEYFVNGKGRKHYTVWMERYPTVAGTILPILREEGVPEDLIFLSMIESGFKLHARSKARAVGAWQFIAETGRRSGLQVDPWVDERLDLELSTRAAARLLKSLYGNYDDWYLAFAAYNAGPGRVNRAMKRANGDRNYWNLRLPAETRNYVPTYLAAREVFRRREEFGFMPGEIESPMVHERVHVPGALTFARLAEMLELPEAELRELNLHVLGNNTAPRGCDLRVPPDKADGFRLALAELPKDAFVTIQHHTVKRGETLGRIAARYGISLSTLRAANNLGSRSLIHPGQKLVISGGNGGARQDTDMDALAVEKDGRRVWTVHPGDALSLIASRSGVSVARLQEWNGLKNSRIYPGQRLWLSPPEHARTQDADLSQNRTANGAVRTYTVKAGDTPGEIADTWGIPLSRLLQANGMSNRAVIHPGQRLVLPDLDFRASDGQATGSRKNETYRVRNGETIEGIARKLSVSTEDLIAANRLKRPDRIKVGQTLVVPGNPVGSESRASAKARTHVVKRGESLWELSQKYGVSIDQLRQWNSLSSDEIKAGTRLKVSQDGQG
ncbi:MAG: LysM peptidoglycan-binding domain-containing protein [Calditrichaeota bacterium]|nr:LysM peptidoglycan-binding domain-containing protein [Calditrichota bacterium]